MRLCSLLFVPGDRPDRFAKAAASGADAVILDLEDSVVPDAKPRAREAVVRAVGEGLAATVLVRVNPLGTDEHAADLAALAGCAPAGVLLPKAQAADDVARLHDALGVPVLPIATETPAGVFALGEYAAVADRLLGLTWGAEDLPAAIGASASRDGAGALLPPYQMVRSLALFAAHAAGVAAIETVFPRLDDDAGLARVVARRAARRLHRHDGHPPAPGRRDQRRLHADRGRTGARARRGGGVRRGAGGRRAAAGRPHDRPPAPGAGAAACWSG